MKTKPSLALALSTLAAVALTACGGGSGSDSSDSNNNSTSPTQTQAASICSGSSTAAAYDVFLPTAAGLTLTSRTANIYEAGNSQCVNIAGSTSQSDNSAIQLVTTDGWNNSISYFDPVGASAVTGASKFNQNLVVTCNAGNDSIRHLAVLNSFNGTSTQVTSNHIASAVKNTAFMSYECTMNGSSVTAGRGNSGLTILSTDGSITVTDSTGSPTSIASADAINLFSSAGYNRNGNIMHGYLYQIPAGTSSKQVVVITNQKADGTYGLTSFYQP